MDGAARVAPAHARHKACARPRTPCPPPPPLPCRRPRSSAPAAASTSTWARRRGARERGSPRCCRASLPAAAAATTNTRRRPAAPARTGHAQQFPRLASNCYMQGSYPLTFSHPAFCALGAFRLRDKQQCIGRTASVAPLSMLPGGCLQPQCWEPPSLDPPGRVRPVTCFSGHNRDSPAS